MENINKVPSSSVNKVNRASFRRKAKEMFELEKLLKSQKNLVYEKPSSFITRIDNHIDVMNEIVFEIRATKQSVNELTCYVMAKQTFLKFDEAYVNAFFSAYDQLELKSDLVKELYRKMDALISCNKKEMDSYIADILK